jgi:hypothetical protein
MIPVKIKSAYLIQNDAMKTYGDVEVKLHWMEANGHL